MLCPETCILRTADGAPLPFDRDPLTRAGPPFVGLQSGFAIDPIAAAVMQGLHSGCPATKRTATVRPPRSEPSRKSPGSVGNYGVGVVHGVRSLPKLFDRDCLTYKRSCDLAVAPALRFVRLAVADDEPTAPGVTFPTARPV
jgi:hypothetical protein